MLDCNTKNPTQSQATNKPNPAQTKSQHWQYKQNIILNCAIPVELSSSKAKQEGRGGGGRGHPTPLQKATEAGDDDCLKTNLE
jgi:hypothetical protein